MTLPNDTCSQRNRGTSRKSPVLLILVFGFLHSCCVRCACAETPHIIFVMADDMGWGQKGYRNHPVLKTPNLNAMAASGLRFERFYAGGPVCSPTRASVLTGRSHDRTGVLSYGYGLRLQEKTIAQPDIFARLQHQLLGWNASMDISFSGKDYPEGEVLPPDPEPVNWYDAPQYQPFLTEWKQRWEYESYLNRATGEKKERKN